MVLGSRDKETKIDNSSVIQEFPGAKGKGSQLMKSVLENDKQIIEDGKLIKDSLNMNIGMFTANMLFEQMVKSYAMARKILGETIIRRLTNYDADYVQKNIKIPEFQRDIQKNIKDNIEELKEKGLLDNEGSISPEGFELASFVLYKEELDHLVKKGILGEKFHKKEYVYGEHHETINYKKGHRYKDIALKESIKLAVKRGHDTLIKEDLKIFTKKSKGQACIIYCLDASGSMKGAKIDNCKKAGIALSYKAIQEKDKVGLIVFGSDIKEEVFPTQDFMLLLKTIARIKASKETNLSKSIERAITLFPNNDVTKHMIIISDALPTIGEKPEQETLNKVMLAKNSGITISVVGINLDEKGEKLAKKIVEMGQGTLYITKNIQDIDTIILEDYYSVR